MLPIAALILTDGANARFDGVDLAERAALAASRAGINYAYFTGPGQPDLTMLKRLRRAGVFGADVLGWPRLFSGVPATRRLVVIDARTVFEPAALVAALRDAASAPADASLVVDVGPNRKNSLMHVADGRITSVMGDGNAMSLGVAIIPAALQPRLASVRSMQDAVHRLAKAGQLRAVSVAPHFAVSLDAVTGLEEIERAFRRHTSKTAIGYLSSRLARVPMMVRDYLRSAQLELSH